MVEKQLAPPVWAFRQTQEDQHYNLRLLNEHLLMEGQIAGEQENDDVVVAMVTKDMGFLDEQWALYQSMHSACDIRHKR